MDIKSELEKVEKEIKALAKDYINTRGKAQITNIEDKILNRKKLPNFKSIIVIDNKPVTILFTDFLSGINTEVSVKDKPKLVILEKRQMALTLLLEMSEDKV